MLKKIKDLTEEEADLICFQVRSQCDYCPLQSYCTDLYIEEYKSNLPSWYLETEIEVKEATIHE